MPHSTSDWVSFALLVALFCPSLLGLGIAAWRRCRQSVDPSHEDFTPGVALHVLNLALSPGVPVYLFHEDAKIGGGSAGGLLSFLIVPIAWTLFFQAEKLIRRAAR